MHEDLINYVRTRARRGACVCGECVDGVAEPAAVQPAGHTVDLVFFKVALNPEYPPADRETLRMILLYSGQRTTELLNGRPHDYRDIGVWLGDQGLALMLMGLGALVGLWVLQTPDIPFGEAHQSDPAIRIIAYERPTARLPPPAPEIQPPTAPARSCLSTQRVRRFHK